eukprot:TRINITY_DN239_c0_g2_i1.p1 TRINITY_DN239_c0_g2~~TRINITY_DN239_c0_g2_i1.p1  ORF type:complete len:447 (+),score=90.27 TRINITY_DN239_c0_g2_i1:183-1343(+)
MSVPGVKETTKQSQSKLAVPKGILKKRTMQKADCHKRMPETEITADSDDDSGFSDVSSNPVGNQDGEAEREDASGSVMAGPEDDGGFSDVSSNPVGNHDGEAERGDASISAMAGPEKEPVEELTGADAQLVDLSEAGEGSKSSNDPSRCRRRSFNYQSCSNSCATQADNMVDGPKKHVSEIKFSDTESDFDDIDGDGRPLEHVQVRNCEGQSRRRSLDYLSCANMVATRPANMDAVDGPKKDVKEIRFSDTESESGIGDMDEDGRPLDHIPARSCEGHSRRRSLDYQSCAKQVAARAVNQDAVDGALPKPDRDDIDFSDTDSDMENRNKGAKTLEQVSVHAARRKDGEGNPTLLTACSVAGKEASRQSSSTKNVHSDVTQNVQASP